MATEYRDGRMVGQQWRFRALKAFSDVIPSPPISGRYYTVFEGSDVNLAYLSTQMGSTDAAAKQVTIRLTVDGNVISGTQLMAHTTWYFWGLAPAILDVVAAYSEPVYGATLAGYNLPWYCQSLKVEIKVEGANLSTLVGYVRYWSL